MNCHLSAMGNGGTSLMTGMFRWSLQIVDYTEEGLTHAKIKRKLSKVLKAVM